MSKGPNKPVLIAHKAQELLQFLDTHRGRPVFHRIHFLLIYLQYARAHNMSKIFHLRLAKFTFFIFWFTFFFP